MTATEPRQQHGTEPHQQHGTGRGVAVSVSVQLVAKGAHLVLNVVSSLAIIRHLAPADYGDFVLVMTLTTLLSLLADFGLNKVAIREVAVDGDAEARVVGTLVVTRVALAVAAAALVQVVLLALGRPAALHLAAAVAALVFVADAVLAVVVSFHVRVQQQYEALSLLLAEAVETALVLALVVSGAGLLALVAAPPVGMAVGVAVAVALTRRRFRLHLSFDRAVQRRLVREAAPVAVAGMLGVLVFKLDVLALAVLRPRRDVGLYGAAMQPVEYALVGAVALVTVLLPVLSRAYATDRHRFVAVYRRSSEALLVVLVPIPIVAAVLATPVVTHVYEEGFDPAARPMRLLAVALVLMVLSAWHAIVLLAAGQQRATVRCNGAALAVAVVLLAALVPPYGAMGAAAATVGTTAFTALVSTSYVARLTGATLGLARIGRIALANAGIGALAGSGVVLGAPAWLVAPLAVAAYPLCLATTGAIDVPSLRRSLAERRTTTALVTPAAPVPLEAP